MIKNKLLVIGDIHLGGKFHSSQDESGYATSELDAIKALEFFYNTAVKKIGELAALIFVGDLTHTNHPTSLVVSYLNDYFHRLQMLNIPVYMIPGNHDAGNYSHSFKFLEHDNFDNIHVLSSGVTSLKISTATLYFAPFVLVGSSLDEKYSTVKEYLQSIFVMDAKRKLIFSHVQESNAKSGSESAMISKSVESLDLDSVGFSDNLTMCVFGHIHQYQDYIKSNGVRVCYTGNPYSMDKSDCDDNKGFLEIDVDTFDTKLIVTPNVRKFYKIQIPVETDALTYLQGIRYIPNSLLFIDNEVDTEADKIFDYQVQDLISAVPGCRVASVKNILTQVKNLVNVKNSSSVDIQLEFRRRAMELHSLDYTEQEFAIFVEKGINRLEGLA